jgi:putative membrane protein
VPVESTFLAFIPTPRRALASPNRRYGGTMTRSTHSFARLVTVATVAMAFAACGPRDNEVAADSAAAATARVDSAPTTTASAGTVDRDMSEAGILGLLAAANAGEIEAANVALQKAKNTRVRDFAQQMKTDHTAMMRQGEQLSQSLSVTPVVPRDEDQLVKEHKDNMEEMNREADFDEEYMEGQIEDHENVLDLIDKALNNTQNAQLRTMLQGARPKVEQHLQLARQIQDQLN